MKITKDFNLKWNKFKHDKRAFISFILLLILFIITTPAEFICNTRPIILVVEGKTFIPVLFSYSEKDFGGTLLSEPDYLSKKFRNLLDGIPEDNYFDSTLFSGHFTDQASYVLGDENFTFGKPIEVRIGSQREDLAIYRRKNGVTWQELPSLNIEGEVFTLSIQSGYFKLGPKTIIVPEETNIHQNYPNPFNPT